MATVQRDRGTQQSVKTIHDPPFAIALFGDVRLAWIWLILRLYVGYEWASAGWGKLNTPAWTGSKAGIALTDLINGALTKSNGLYPDVQYWYAAFLQHIVLPNVVVWSFVISWGETILGFALILGIFTGIAAFFGSFMNVNYLMVGAVGTNPILFVIAIWLVLTWKTAGWWGLDRWALRALGTPLTPGYIFTDGASDPYTLHSPGKA